MSRQLTALAGRLGRAAPPSAPSSPSQLVTRLLSNSVHQAGKGSKHPKPNAKWGQNRKQHQPAAAVAADAAAGALQGAGLAEAQGNLGVLLNGRGAGEARDRWRPAHAGPSSDRQQEYQAEAAKGKGGGAAQFRQHQAQAAQRGQSVLGSSGVGAGAGPKLDVATFQRFSNIQERLDRARSNGQGQGQGQGQGASQYPANGNQQQQQQQQHRRNGKRQHQHQQPQQQPQQGGWNGAGGASATAAFAPLPAVNGAAAARSRWARIEGAPGAPAAAAGVSVQARLWEAEEEEQEQEAPSQQLQAQQRRERRAAGQQQQQLQQQLQQQQASKKRKGPRLDRRLRLLTRVPLVLPHEPITVRELSQRLAMKMKDVGKRLVRLGGREEYGGLSPDSLVDLDVAELLGLELGRTVKRMEPAEDLLEYKSRSRESRPDWPLRAPVVCVMGHVDHGKTTLLDALRKTTLAAGEAGGITQRLGAFHIPSGLAVSGKGKEAGGQEAEAEAEAGGGGDGVADLGITVLDTPGHAAFSAMRLNGALATDIVLLVVSASDGVQAQTEEVLQLVAQEGVALMVAVTKADKLGSEAEVQERLRAIERELAARGVLSEALGGDVQLVPVSARKGQGLAELRERLVLQAEVLELRADRQAPGEGLLLDCYVDRGLGVVVNVLMRWGALQPGDFVVAGDQCGRVKRILDEGGAALERALPSMPVRVLGFKELPAPGQGLIVVKSEERAQAVAEARRSARERQRLEEAEEVEALDEEDEGQLREILERKLVGANSAGKKTKAFLALQRGSMEDVLEGQGTWGGSGGSGSGGRRTGPVVVPFLVKADGKGTLDAVTAALAAYQSDVIRAEVVGAGCGAVTEGDLERALAAGESDAGRPCTVLAFGVGFTHAEVGEQARRAGVAVRQQSVIYSLLDDVKAALQAHMPMERVETPVGMLEVQATFALTGRRRTRNRVAGCQVVQGSAFSAPSYRYRVRRGDAVLCEESAPTTLYHFKEQVQEVSKGMECGLSLEAFGDFEPGDVIEAYTVVERPRDIKHVFRY